MKKGFNPSISISFQLLIFLFFSLKQGLIEGVNKKRGNFSDNTTSFEQQKNNRPNILLILADDVGTGDIPGYWDTGIVEMPHIKSLVRKGVKFTDAHSTPLCAPSRYVLLSGNYQHRGLLFSGTWRINYQSGQFRRGELSIADVLRSNAGYHTGMMGKWHVGAKVATQDWFEPSDAFSIKDVANMLSDDRFNWSKPIHKGPQDIGFDSSLITISGIQQAPYIFFRDGMVGNISNITFWKTGKYSMPEGKSIIYRPGEGSPDWDSTAYNMVLVNETARFLNDHEKSRKEDPFFAYVSLGSVHIPHSPPISYLDGSPVAGQYPSSHMDVLGEMDKIVGSLLQLLEEKKVLEDTLIIFSSDNGGLGHRFSDAFGHNSHGPLRGVKGSIYEGGHRVPLIMRWDNGSIPANETRTNLVGLNDLFATICELVGIDVPEAQAVDSKSFAGHVKKEQNVNNLREELGVWLYKNSILIEESIRNGHLKLIKHLQNNTMSLYDLNSDISEVENLIHNSIYKGAIDEMLQSLEKNGPCHDNPDYFYIMKKGEKKKTNCEWFSQNEEKRCNRFHEGQIECRVTCGRRYNSKSCNLYRSFQTAHPSTTPTKDPTLWPSSDTSPVPSLMPSLALSESPSKVLPKSSPAHSESPSNVPSKPSPAHSESPSNVPSKPSPAVSESPSKASSTMILSNILKWVCVTSLFCL